MVDVYYKYRSLDNWRFLLDILLEKRLYAASFRDLNDPMEGRYHYQGDSVTRAFRSAIRASKDEWRICSLSEHPKSTLMWSYYAGGHTGVVLGVNVKRRTGQRVRPILYDQTMHVGSSRKSPSDVALEILSQKQMSWSHEHEVRVFSRAPFVPVEIREVLLGCQTADADRELVKKLVRETNPGVTVRQLRRRDLDSPLQNFRHA